MSDALDLDESEQDWVPTTEQICQKLIDYCLCPAGEPYVGNDAVEGSDHGHTACFFVGWAIKRLSELQRGSDAPRHDHRQSIWVIGGGSWLWCYRCGAIRPNVEGRHRWEKPTGPRGPNPASERR